MDLIDFDLLNYQFKLYCEYVKKIIEHNWEWQRD